MPKTKAAHGNRARLPRKPRILCRECRDGTCLVHKSPKRPISKQRQVFEAVNEQAALEAEVRFRVLGTDKPAKLACECEADCHFHEGNFSSAGLHKYGELLADVHPVKTPLATLRACKWCRDNCLASYGTDSLHESTRKPPLADRDGSEDDPGRDVKVLAETLHDVGVDLLVMAKHLLLDREITHGDPSTYAIEAQAAVHALLVKEGDIAGTPPDDFIEEAIEELCKLSSSCKNYPDEFGPERIARNLEVIIGYLRQGS